MSPDKTKLDDTSAEVAGHCDGLDDDEIYGWAWRPAAPETRVEVEQWVDGVLALRSVANIHRADLEAAGIGDGRHGWRMRLALDPAAPGPQRVEIRAERGALLPQGAFDLTYDRCVRRAKPDPAAPIQETWGICDGRDGDRIHGWAWRPIAPEQHVEVEQWVDGALAARTVADLLRGDLRATGVGHGRYGWEMRLKLDPSKAEPQSIELRIRGGGLLVDGRLRLRADEIGPASADPGAQLAPSVTGRCDGLKGSALVGWAWNPQRPEEPVEIELWAEGVCLASCVADGFRPDVRADGVGTGRYGWRLPVDLGREAPITFEVRAKGGALLQDGVFELKNDLSVDDPANAALLPLVTAVLNDDRVATPPAPQRRALLLYCPEPVEEGPFWGRQFDDYPSVMMRFAPALARLGDVFEAPSLAAAEAICTERRQQGQVCTLFSFGPPRQTPLSTFCPVVPVFGWGFPTIPTGAWDGDIRSDWRNVLRLTGRAVSLSSFAAQAVKAAVGADFPVMALPPPAPTTAQISPQPARSREIALGGLVFDSRDHVFDPDDPALPAQVWRGEAASELAARTFQIQGVLFTSFLDFDDARKNWTDVVSAFATAHKDNPDAVLLLKLGARFAAWMQELYRFLALLPPFACRIIAMRGPLNDADYHRLIKASHWGVSASNAEGMCLAIQDFLAAGRPAIAPAHTAFADMIDAEDALVVASDEEAWRWPDPSMGEGWSFAQHPDDIGPTTRFRVSWPSLAAAFKEAYRLVTAAPEAYDKLAGEASRRMQRICNEEMTAAAIEALLAQESQPASLAENPSLLIRDLAGG